MKQWIVNFKFKEAVASRYFQSTTVTAANIGLAVNRAWAIVKQREGVKGKRLKNVDISISLMQDISED